MKTKKLSLNKQTIANLNQNEMNHVKGGEGSVVVTCWTTHTGPTTLETLQSICPGVDDETLPSEIMPAPTTNGCPCTQ